MLVNVDANRLMRFLDACDDAESLGGGEYTLDLYDLDEPVTMDIAIEDGKVDVLAALELLFDEESQGWYPGERIRDGEHLAAMLRDACGG